MNYNDLTNDGVGFFRWMLGNLSSPVGALVNSYFQVSEVW